jgi:hypothetical protein
VCMEAMDISADNMFLGVNGVRIHSPFNHIRISADRLLKFYYLSVYEDRLCGLVVRDPEAWVRFPALPHFPSSSGTGTWSKRLRSINPKIRQ